eukprot:753871-Hanusia_phi.AAC.5
MSEGRNTYAISSDCMTWQVFMTQSGIALAFVPAKSAVVTRPDPAVIFAARDQMIKIQSGTAKKGTCKRSKLSQNWRKLGWQTYCCNSAQRGHSWSKGARELHRIETEGRIIVKVACNCRHEGQQPHQRLTVGIRPE